MKKNLWCAVLAACIAGLPVCRLWGGGVMIYPKYLEFDAKNKVREVMLVNPSAEETASYRVSVKYMRQKPGGGYEEVSGPALDDASGFLRYSPRSVTLGPRRSQNVKFLARVPKEAMDGEYVAYAVFTKIIAPKPLTARDLEKKDGVSVEIIPIPSFAVPVIVRKGEKFHSAPKLEQARLSSGEDGSALLKVRLRRTDGDKKQPESSVRADVSVWAGDELLAVSKGRYVLAHNEYADVLLYPARSGKAVSSDELRGKTLTFCLTPVSEADGADCSLARERLEYIP